MVSSDRKKEANAVGGKSTRACDGCVRRRARWYCAADDAFLCQSCDSSVHSANPLARRHERVRLRMVSVRSSDDESRPGTQTSVPMWHQGFIKKPRTPRRKKCAKISNPLHLVPEICSEEHSHEENEDQLLYRVPIFDPLVAELRTSTNSNESVRNNSKNANETALAGLRHETKPVPNDLGQEMNHFQGLLPSEMDLAEFAADVESLLGKGLEDESFDIEGLGLLDCGEMQKVKVEDEEIDEVANRGVGQEFIDVGRETFDLNFGYDSPVTGEEEDHKAEILKPNFTNDSGNPKEVPDSKRKGIFLKLDYKGVLSAWDGQKSPWTTGERPDLNSGGCWPDCTDAMCGTMHAHRETGVTSGHAAAKTADGGREARVSRYREKRRTRLFSKKIRYEVRKLNAEKRPRMKGRFVKRANLVAPAAPFAISQ